MNSVIKRGNLLIFKKIVIPFWVFPAELRVFLASTKFCIAYPSISGAIIILYNVA